MCLVAFALDLDRRFPFVVAANRDEYFKRPSTRLAWWTPHPNGPAILSGRDLESGGTWLGLTTQGRLALLTNIRDPLRNDPSAPTRGKIVPDWLSAQEPVDRFWMRTALSGHNGFNLIAADFRLGECLWASSAGAYPLRLERGVYGLSNAALDTPWPKVQALKQRLRESIAQAPSVEALAVRLFTALADKTVPNDAALPQTGVPLAWERDLAPAFIRSSDGQYGTRCSTLVITERANRHLVTHVMERSFSAEGGATLLRRSTLRGWPPRHSGKAGAIHVEQGPVSESEIGIDVDAVLAPLRARGRAAIELPG